MLKGKFDKYIDMEFYFEGEHMNYNGYDDMKGLTCHKCGKRLAKGHDFTVNDKNQESRFFGNECIKNVIGAGFFEESKK